MNWHKWEDEIMEHIEIHEGESIITPADLVQDAKRLACSFEKMGEVWREIGKVLKNIQQETNDKDVKNESA